MTTFPATLARDARGWTVQPLDGWLAGVINADRRQVARYVLARCDERRASEGAVVTVAPERELVPARGRRPAVVACRIVADAPAIWREIAPRLQRLAEAGDYRLASEAAGLLVSLRGYVTAQATGKAGATTWTPEMFRARLAALEAGT